MNSTKSERSEAAKRAAQDRRIKAATSLLHCLARSNVMRFHHDDLVQEMLDANSPTAVHHDVSVLPVMVVGYMP